MVKRVALVVSFLLVLCLIAGANSYAAETRETLGQKFVSFWQKIFNYPASVTDETAGVVTDAVKGTTGVVTTEVRTVGQVTSGSVDKTPALVTEPLTGTAETAKQAVEGTVAIPAEANKEKTE